MAQQFVDACQLASMHGILRACICLCMRYKHTSAKWQRHPHTHMTLYLTLVGRHRGVLASLRVVQVGLSSVDVQPKNSQHMMIRLETAWSVLRHDFATCTHATEWTECAGGL